MSSARQILDQCVEVPEMREMGRPMKVEIQSSLSPFFAVPGYRISYPAVVIEALEKLYFEYNCTFVDLIPKNREWETDYQYCYHDTRTWGGPPINCAVQIDMMGLPQVFLEQSDNLSEKEIRAALKERIFEIENSLAMYQLLERIFSSNGANSFFKERFRASLDEIRGTFHKPIALLAVTDQKYEAMKASEFGKHPYESLSDGEVKDLSGFDCFFGPEQFREYVAYNRGECHHLLYVRTSDPIAKLKNPDMKVEHPLLGDHDMRWLIKANALTMNIDAPGMDYCARINDTKEYMPLMGMAFRVNEFSDVLTPGLMTHMSRGRAYAGYSQERVSCGFAGYMAMQGYDSAEVESGDIVLRAKPMKGTYGCYGHVTGALNDQRFRSEFQRNLRKRGSYVLQPEMRMPVVINQTDGQAYTYIDRNFFACTSAGMRFLGGFRSLMPLDSIEAKNGRIHGNGSTVWAEIIASDC